MLQDHLIRLSGLEGQPFILILDQEGLWRKGSMENAVSQRGYACEIAETSVDLRYLYERYIVQDRRKTLILYEGDYIPYDIRRQMHILDASLQGLFPHLHTHALRRFPNINLDLLCCAYPTIYTPLNSVETERLCMVGIWSTEIQLALCEKYEARCRQMLSKPPSPEAWGEIAAMLGFLITANRQGVGFAAGEELASFIHGHFCAWMQSDYRYLSGTSCAAQPLLMNQTLDFMRRRGKKLALIVLDGMSFADYHVLLRCFADASFRLSCTGMFGFVPSITSVARQSLFSGKLPVEHEKPFSLQYEERQWRQYWLHNGYREEEIFFSKAEVSSPPSYVKVAGFVIGMIDELMHNQLQGGVGMARDVSAWLQQGILTALLQQLIADGFRVFLTADHGNTCATGQGRFIRPSLITESASRRAAIFQRFDDAQELAKFDTTEYTGTYMPQGYRYSVFAPGTCYGDLGSEYVTHGGMTIEEMIVPFVQIGEQ